MRLTSVVIPTFRRLDLLPIAIESAFAQKVTTSDFEIVAVDNSPEGSAMPYLRSVQAKSPAPMTVLHEPRPGVAYARNAALAAAKGELIAFLDDDTRCGSGWLQALLDVRDKFGADMVFSPSFAEAPSAPPAHRAFIESLFTRPGPGKDGLTSGFSAASSSLHVRATVLANDPPFPLGTNDTGGEDDMVFVGALSRGAKAAWAVDAFVHEIIPPIRANLKYAYRRSFAFGQGACRTCYYGPNPSFLVIAMHMMIGLGQAGIYGALGGGAWLLGLPNRASILNQAVRGLGKVIWFQPTHFYGNWLARNTAPPASTPAAQNSHPANQNDAQIEVRSADAR